MKNLLTLLAVVCIVSCQAGGDEDAHPSTVSTAAPESTVEIDVANPGSMVGKPLGKVAAACDAAKVPHRVVELDGKVQPVTMDYNSERLNFRVKAGLVIVVTKG